MIENLTQNIQDSILPDQKDLLENTKDVLDTWRGISGTKEDGSIEEKTLNAWVKTARKKCAESKIVTDGDLQIAFMLAHSPNSLQNS